MKRMILALLAAGRIAFAPQQAQAAAPIEAGICIGIAVIGAAVIIRACQPTWRCTSDPENPGSANWCSAMPRSIAQRNGLIQVGPNYRTYAACMRICSTNGAASYLPPDADPLLVVFRSTDLITWSAVGLLEMDYDAGLSWTDPEPPSAECCFYQVKEFPAGSQWKPAGKATTKPDDR